MDICGCRFDWTFQEYVSEVDSAWDDIRSRSFYVEDTEEGWGVFRMSDRKPVAGPSLDKGLIDRICASKNRRALALRPQDV